MMTLEDFIKQQRGAYHFETWLYNQAVSTAIGPLPLEIYTEIDCAPSCEIIGVANRLAIFVSTHGIELLDIIHAHYRRAEQRGWLAYWNTPPGLSKSEVLKHVESITLNVHSDLYAGIHVDPKWEPEHKLALTFAGEITEVNDEPYKIVDGVLSKN